MGELVPVTGCDPVLALVNPSNSVGTSVRWPPLVSPRSLYSRTWPQRNGRATRVNKPFFSFMVGLLRKPLSRDRLQA